MESREIEQIAKDIVEDNIIQGIEADAPYIDKENLISAIVEVIDQQNKALTDEIAKLQSKLSDEREYSSRRNDDIKALEQDNEQLQSRIEELEKENRHLAYQTSIYLDEMRKMKSDETPNFKEDA